MHYNHKKAIESLSEDGYIENIKWAMNSFGQMIRNESITCRGCEKNFEAKYLYRCFFCGSYFCVKCSEIHFGSRT